MRPAALTRAAVSSAAAAALLAGMLFFATSAQALGGITSFSMSPSLTQAGGHPDIEVDASFTGRLDETPPPGTCNCHDPEQITFHYPTGIIGNPHAVPTCTLAQFSQSQCPPDSQIGVVRPGFGDIIPLFNMVPHPNEAGLFGFNLALINAPIFIAVSARTGSDYGLDATGKGIFHILPLANLGFVLWGVPAAPQHDALRFPIGLSSCQIAFIDSCFSPQQAGVPPAPFLENPTSCGTPLTASLDVGYYDDTTSHADSPWPATTGCDQLSFNPSLTAKPTTTQADTSSGLDIDLKVPQNQSPTTPSPSEIRATTVTLPEGFSLNPNGSDGKLACTDAQAGFGTDAAAQCPEQAKIGTVTLDSSALPGPISGGIYIGTPEPDQIFRVILTADGYATHVKLLGLTDPDPQTGRLVTKFLDLPQSPFQEFDMHFFGSERGIFSAPNECGTYPVRSEFVPWDSALPNQISLGSFAIDSGPNGSPCPGVTRTFNPHLRAGTAAYAAGVHAPFALELNRDDGDQNVSGLDLTTPPGFSATLKGIPYCPQAAIDQLADPTRSGLAEQASPACPAASQVGTAFAGSGSGTHPIYNSGKVYLAGPYKGAPLSFESVIPALGGPYDLGNVAVRTALNVDPITAQVSANSDPFPQILAGVPLRMRSLRISLDRPDFTLNPTNCDPFTVDSTIFGDQGGTAAPRVHFQVANCADLGFAPKLAFRLKGGTKRNGHPALHATLTARPGDANIASTVVALPPTEQTDSNHLGSSCTRTQFAASACPANTVIGTATATSPLLDSPLRGTVYLVSAGNTLPDIVAALRGQLPIDLHGVVDTAKNGALRTTFKTVPDVPVTRFDLNLRGAKKGLVVNNTDICLDKRPAVARITGQNGKTINRKVSLNPSCGKARHKRHRLGAKKAVSK